MDWSDFDSRACSVARTAAILGDGWTVLVLRDVFNGVRRFDEIRDHLGISRSVLSQRLAQLVDEDILERRPYREPGDRTRHEYRLTDRGRDLLPVLTALMRFGDRHLSPDGPPVVLEHRGCGAPVTTELVCAAGHRIEGTRETVAEAGPGARPRHAGSQPRS